MKEVQLPESPEVCCLFSQCGLQSFQRNPSLRRFFFGEDLQRENYSILLVFADLIV
jgi:hypothetical protein